MKEGDRSSFNKESEVYVAGCGGGLRFSSAAAEKSSDPVSRQTSGAENVKFYVGSLLTVLGFLYNVLMYMKVSESNFK